MSDKIRKSIDYIVNEHIKQRELKEKLLEFVDYQSKEGFPFGELLVLHYNMFNGTKIEEIYTVAAAVEILILSFDILDDFEDQDSKDKPWSEESHLALNVTTALLFLSTHILRNTDFENKEIGISIMSTYALQSINGQHLDLLNTCKNEADYIEMTLEKSGSLVSMACLVGAALASDHYPLEIERYSRFIGLIGQINNDLMDIRTWNEKNDLVNKKFTLPIIYLLNYPDEELTFIHEYYRSSVEKNVILQKQELIETKFIETGAIKYTEVIKNIYQNKVLTELQKLDVNQQHIELVLKYTY